MSLTFSNPAALWSLLGIPAVIAIHFLQRRSQRVVSTTLFLLQQMRRESETGNRIDRLRVSIPFWMQLLMVLIFTWLLAGPRWLKNDAVQRIAIVLDASASMSAFRQPALDAVTGALDSLLNPLSRVELSLLASDPEAPPLYHGASAAELRVALKQWQPLLGVHDFNTALRSARSLVGESGVLLLVTDHVTTQKPGSDAKVISVGGPKANVGWAGVTVERKEDIWIWRAVVRNYSGAPQLRGWHARTDAAATESKTITLEPHETRTMSGPFPTDASGLMATRMTLVLTADEFTLDDQLPLVMPKPKVITLLPPKGRAAIHEAVREFIARFDDTAQADDAKTADIIALVWPSALALPDDRHTCIFTAPPIAEQSAYLTGRIVAEAHALTDGLNWQGLLVREGVVIPPAPQDRVLVWQGERPLISLRTTTAGKEQLLCHFDLITSNARKLPALAILLHRFFESVRAAKIAPETANFDLRQRLVVAHDTQTGAADLICDSDDDAAQRIPLAQARLLRAPSLPGFFTVKQGETGLLAGAAHFADAREADLSSAAPFSELSEAKAAHLESVHEADPAWRLWLLVLLSALLVSWWFARERLGRPQSDPEGGAT